MKFLVATKFFQVSCHFSMYLLNFSKFHDISRFSRCTLIFPGFPGRVGTLRKIPEGCNFLRSI